MLLVLYLYTMGYEVQTGMLALNNNSKRLMRHNIMIQVLLSISKKKRKKKIGQLQTYVDYATNFIGGLEIGKTLLT